VDRDRRKFVIILVIVALVLIGPLTLLSPWGLAHLEGVVQNNLDKPWAPTLQLRCAAAYGYTLQKDSERAAYETFYKTEAFKSDPRRGYAKFMVALCLDRDFRNSRHAAANAYQDFLDEFEYDEIFHQYPEWQKYVQDARSAVERLRSAAY
jgi:hypothetical protein